MIHLLLMLFLNTTPGDYLVLKVNGVAMVKGKKDPLKAGQHITDADSIRFSEPGSYVVVISPEKGRMQLTESSDARYNAARNELFESVASSLKLSKSYIVMAGRSAPLNNEEEFIKWLNAIAPKDMALLVIDTMQIPLGNYFETKDNDHFFLLNYNNKGEKINKRLSSYNDGQGNFFLVLDKNIFTVDGKQTGIASASECKWFYYNSKSQDAVSLGTIAITVMSGEKIKPEICLLKQELIKKSNSNSDTISSEIYSYLKDIYGTTNTNTVSELAAQICE